MDRSLKHRVEFVDSEEHFRSCLACYKVMVTIPAENGRMIEKVRFVPGFCLMQITFTAALISCIDSSIFGIRISPNFQRIPDNIPDCSPYKPGKFLYAINNTINYFFTNTKQVNTANLFRDSAKKVAESCLDSAHLLFYSVTDFQDDVKPKPLNA